MQQTHTDPYTDSNSDPLPLSAAVGIGLLAVLFALLLYGIAVSVLVPPETRGQFGDMFGALNTAFSGLAFAAVVVTLIKQGHALRVTRSDFERALELQRQSLVALHEEIDIARWQQRLTSTQIARDLVAVTLKTLEAQSPYPSDQVTIAKNRLRKLEVQLDELVSHERRGKNEAPAK